MIGVTIGVGYPYSRLADLAVACVEKHTGIKCQILTHTQFLRSGLKHPAALRLAMFEYFDQPDILYFDADWMCLNPWHPLRFEDWGNVIACRDFTLDIHYPKQDYLFTCPEFAGTPGVHFSGPEQGVQRAEYCQHILAFTHTDLPYSAWPNTGLFIVNQKRHRQWLERALVLYSSVVGHHNEYFEQPALLKALDDSEVTIDYLPRKFNVLATKRRQWPASVIGLHVKIKHHPEFIAAVEEGLISTPDQAREYFIEGGGDSHNGRNANHR